MARTINAAGLKLVQEFEGCKLTAYRDIANVLTIGFGSTGSHVKPGMTISQGEADELLLEDLERFEAAVEKATAGTRTSDNEFAACVSLAFNVGIAAFNRSTVLKRHRLGNKTGAANAFLLWNKARVGGKLTVVRGLTRRREAERKLYLTPDAVAPSATPVKPPERPATPQAPDLAPMTPNDRDRALAPPASCLAAVLGMFRK